MQSMTPARRDPAPSRAAYRLHRMMLTPGFRRFLGFWLPLLLITAAAAAWLSNETRRLELAATIAEVQRQIEERPEFMVRLMAVEGASLPVTDAIRTVVPIDFPISSFDIDLAEVQAQVASLEAVKSAQVHVRTGGVLAIEVVERVPAALWRGRDGLFLIDDDGFRIAGVAERGEFTDLPLLAGTGAGSAVPEALQLIAAAEPIAPRLRGLLRVGERRWDLILDRDQRVLLPETGAITALQRVIALDEAQDLFGRDISLVDMRNSDRPTVRLTPAGINGLRQIYDLQGAD